MNNLKEFDQALAAILIALILFFALLYSLIYGFVRVSSGCIGSFDSYRVCDQYGFNRCHMLSVTEWKHISPYVATTHRFERVGNPSQVRNYRHHNFDCIDSKGR
jgi:hypothetical protein